MKDTIEFEIDEKVRDVFRNIFVFYGTLTPDGYVLNLMGDIFERIETAPELLIGQKFSETVYWQSTEQTPDSLEQAIAKSANGEKSKTTLDFRINSQEKIVIDLFLFPQSNSQSELKHLFFCAEDVSDREQEIKYHKNINEQMLCGAEDAGVGLWFWNLAEETMFATPKCGELFGISHGEAFTPQSLTSIIHPQDRKPAERAFRDAQVSGKPLNVEYRIVYSDGKIRRISVIGKTHFDDKGNPRNISGIVR